MYREIDRLTKKLAMKLQYQLSNGSWVNCEDLKAFPIAATREAGHQLNKVQSGIDPNDFKPMPTIGAGVHEIRIHDDANNQFRVIYIAKFEESIYVLHAFHKTTEQTSKSDIDLASVRLRQLNAKRLKLKTIKKARKK